MKKKLAAILLCTFLVTGLTGCGNKVPAGTVATVNDVAISQEELDIIIPVLKKYASPEDIEKMNKVITMFKKR